MNRRAFYYFFIAYSLLALLFSLGLTVFYIDKDNQNFENISQTYIFSYNKTNMTEIEKCKHDEPLYKLIEWDGQGTISWGVGFLTAITVFFTILFSLHPKEDDINNQPMFLWIKNNPEDTILSCLAGFFMIMGIMSIFMMTHYYRSVSYLQDALFASFVFQRTAVYIFIMHFYVEWSITILFLVFFLFLMWREPFFINKNYKIKNRRKNIILGTIR